MSSLQDNVFGPTCAIDECHGSVDTQEELLMTSAQVTFENLVDVESEQRGANDILVVPGDPNASYLINKLTGVGMDTRSSIGEETEQMPRQGGVCEFQLDAIRQWISEGAQNN